MKSKYILFLFLSFAITDVYGVITQNMTIRYIFKPLLLVSLTAYYLAATKQLNRLYVVALLLCLAGDVFLMFKGSQNFILGLVSFLLGHVFYIIILAKKSGHIITKTFVKAAIPFLIVFAALISILFKSLGGMLVPVIIYGVTICSMGTFALYYYLKSKNIASLLFFVGSSFFIFSDSLLAVNKFLTPKHFLAISVMITYIIAQYLICEAMLKDETT